MNKKLFWGAALALSIGLAGCGQSGGTITGKAAMDRPVLQAFDDSHRGYPWQFMTFLALDNDLADGSDALMSDLNGAGRSSRSVSYITEFDGPRHNDSVRYAQAAPGEKLQKTSLGEIISGAPQAVGDLLQFAATQPPVQRRVLTLSDHGGGIVRGVLADWNTPTGKQIMHIQDLAPHFKRYPVDILVFDACFMQMAEVAYELRDGVKYIVGAQTTTRGSFPYTDMAAALEREPQMLTAAAAGELARIISESAWYELALGVMDTSRTVALAPKVRTLADILIGKMPALRKEILGAVKASLAYGHETEPGLELYNDFRDLGDIARQLQRLADPGIRQAAQEVEKACLDHNLVPLQLSRGARMKGGTGVMTYAATSGEVAQRYLMNNRWSQDTHWGDFLVKLNSDGSFANPVRPDRYPWSFPSKKR